MGRLTRPLDLATKLRVTRGILIAERLLERLVPALCVAGAALGICLLDLPTRVPTWAHVLSLALTAIVETALIRRACRQFPWPTKGETERRLERDSRAPHRPLAAMADHPAPISGGDNPGTAQLWDLHQQRMADVAASLFPGPPRPRWSRHDPKGVRFGILALLVVGLLVAGRDSPDRLSRNLLPGLDGANSPVVQAWVLPPPATLQAPWVLDPGRQDQVAIPEGATLRIQVSPGFGRARLVTDDQVTDFVDAPDGSQRLETVIGKTTRLDVRRLFHSLARWRVGIEPDLPPTVAFTHPPQAAEGQRVDVSVTATDDHGLTRLWLDIRPADPTASATPVILDLPLSKKPPPKVTVEGRLGPGVESLAGLPVTVTPWARDTANQDAAGQPEHLVWPERRFGDPTAKSIAEKRRELLQHPDTAKDIAKALPELQERVANLPKGDAAAYLDLGLARNDLDSDPPNIAEAQSAMSAAAQRLENRAEDRARQALGDMGRALDEARAKGAKPAELDALARRYADMLEQAMKTGNPGDGPPLPMDPNSIDDILRRLDQLAGGKLDETLRHRLESLAQRLAQAGQTGQSARDPFGRTAIRHSDTPEADSDDATTRVPGEGESTPSRQILDEIRRRVMDGTRPKDERDYLRRLME